jgi:hypothetical protein
MRNPVQDEDLIAPPSTSGSSHTVYTLPSSQWAQRRVWHIVIHGTYQIEGQGSGQTATLTFALFVGGEDIDTFSVSVGPQEPTARGVWTFDLILSCDATGSSNTLEAHCRRFVTGPDTANFAKGAALQATTHLSHVDQLYNVNTSSNQNVRVKVTASKSLSSVTWSRQRGIYPAMDVV